MANMSHSRVELYSSCPRKYYYQYVEKWSPDKTFTPLLFGGAIDQALNYVLLRTKHNHTPHPETAKAIFKRQMNVWNGQNELSYFKNESPNDDAFNELGELDKQWAVHAHLISVGYKMIDVYIKDILPQFKRITSVQTKRNIPNETGDNLVLITDFNAELHDGRAVCFDNKTSSDIKKYYGPSSVKKSQQLAIYTEFEPTKLAGYVALQKKLVDGEVIWKMVIDEIEEEQTAAAFQKIDDVLTGIKNEDFSKNEKACFQYGKLCEFAGLCKRNNSKGLVKR